MVTFVTPFPAPVVRAGAGLRRRLLAGLCSCVTGAVWAAAGATPLPARDLTVEVRQVHEGRDDAVHYQASSHTATPTLESTKVQVRNGEKAELHLEQSVPMQWTSSVQSQSPQAGSGTASGGAVQGATQSLHWFDVGQSLSVQVRWPGGNRDAQVEFEVQTSDMQHSDMQAGSSGHLPAQRRTRLHSTVTAPLAQWVTVAASGAEPVRQGSYSSEPAGSARRLLQIRVLVP